MPATLTPQIFVAKWCPIELYERAMAQEHFIDLCRLLDHPTPAEADPSRTWYTFEAGATKATGGQGYADVWKRDFFAWEYKGNHADLDRAYGQLLFYSGALGNPPLLIVCDGHRFRIHTHFTHTVRVSYEFTLDDLLQPAKLDLLRKAFTDPEALRSPVTTAQVTEQAATHFARIAQILRRYDHPAPAVAHFLIRLLFCLFAEDIGILPPDLFSHLVTRPGQNATAFMAQLRQLFAAMATGGFFGVETIKHIDGGLFNDDNVLLLDSDSLRILAEVCGLNWAAIEPVILGTLFERGLDPEKRSQLGAHFTAKDDILLVVEPVLMAPLRREWAALQAQVRLLADQLGALDEVADAERTAAARQQRRGRRTVLRGKALALLAAFRQKLAGVQILDPACGSGNFLYVALWLLLDLEKAVINLTATLGEPISLPLVSPAQLHGIEINPYAFELAQATIWIGYIQWLRDNGFGLPAEPILKPLTTFRQMDAILDLTGFADAPIAGEAGSKPVRSREVESSAVDAIPDLTGFADAPIAGEAGSKPVRSREVEWSAVDAIPDLTGFADAPIAGEAGSKPVRSREVESSAVDAIPDLTGFADAPIAGEAGSKPVRSREVEWSAVDAIPDLTGFADAPIAGEAGSKPVRSREVEWLAVDAIPDLTGFADAPIAGEAGSKPVRSREVEWSAVDAIPDLTGFADAPIAGEAGSKPVRSREPDWPAVDVIIGNPPFLGGGKIRAELGDAYTDALFKLYGDRLPNFSDLCCYWFEKARAMIEAGRTKRAGLLATNSIRGGANRTVLERIKQTGDIFWAHSDREWVLEGAAVNVSMVGFDDGVESSCVLDDKPVKEINPDLTATVNLTNSLRLAENSAICFQGPSPKAPFDIDAGLAQSMILQPPNPNGRPNSDVVRPLLSATDIVQTPRNLWTIDFGLMNEDQAALYEMPFEYLRKHVWPIRSNNRRASYAKKWWQYAEARPGMRIALQDKVRYIATPALSKYRMFVWVELAVLSNQGTLVFARDDDYFFGVLHSKPHELWALRMGTSLEDRPRYTPTTCFETFPFPWPPDQEPADDPRVEAIAQAARELVQLRDAWLNPVQTFEVSETSKVSSSRTLTNLYNARPTWLDHAHKKLDAAVFAAYGWPAAITDEEILARLLARAGK